MEHGAQSHYEVLGLHADAAAADIKKAFRSAALQHHPDKGGDAEVFKQINAVSLRCQER